MAKKIKKKTIFIISAIVGAILAGIYGVHRIIENSSAVMLEYGVGGHHEIYVKNHNAVLLKYEGEKKGSEVKQMITEVIVTNERNLGINDERIISINGQSTSEDIVKERRSILADHTYRVTLNYDNTGFITEVIVTEK